jgi:hypothetical protein
MYNDTNYYYCWFSLKEFIEQQKSPGFRNHFTYYENSDGKKYLVTYVSDIQDTPIDYDDYISIGLAKFYRCSENPVKDFDNHIPI